MFRYRCDSDKTFKKDYGHLSHMYEETEKLDFDSYLAVELYPKCTDNQYCIDYQAIKFHAEIYELTKDEIAIFASNIHTINSTIRMFDTKMYDIVFKDYEEAKEEKKEKEKAKRWK